MPARPQLRNDLATTPANTPVNIFVLANDTLPGGGQLKITAVRSPTARGGTAVINPGAQSVRYTPPPGFIGTDIFTYEARPV
jgi:large repetitive protein